MIVGFFNFKRSIVVLLLAWIGITALGQTPDRPLQSLDQLLREMLRPVSTAPDEQAPGGKKWVEAGRAWNTLAATSTNEDISRAYLVTVLQDTMPLAALIATNRKERYDYLQIDESLTGGWKTTLHAAAETGKIEWGALEKGNDQCLVFGRPGESVPQFLAVPQPDGAYVLLFWDTLGENFEFTALYDPLQGVIKAFGTFAITPSLLRYIFVKTDEDQWIELTFRKGKTVAAALHRQIPGNLQSVVLDLNMDGKMDILNEVSPESNQITIRKINAPTDMAEREEIQTIKQEIAEKAASANATWLKLQGIWMQLNPLGVQLPEVVRL